MLYLIFVILGLAASINSKDCSTCDTTSAVNADTCIVSKDGTGQSWMQMSDTCLHDGGRLLLMKGNDTNVKEFCKSPFVNNLTSSTDRLVIALMVSRNNDQNVILYDKSVVKNNASCSKATLADCMNSSSIYANQTNCESIGCCWNNKKCVYPGLGQFLIFDTFDIVPANIGKGRGCLYMEKDKGSFANPKWIWTDCFAPVTGKTKFICEYACNGSFPTRKTVTGLFANGLSTTTPSAGSYNSSTKSPISGTNTKITTDKSNGKNGSPSLGKIHLMYLWSALSYIVLLTG